jgi:hypothetical protein
MVAIGRYQIPPMLLIQLDKQIINTPNHYGHIPINKINKLIFKYYVKNDDFKRLKMQESSK